MRRAGATKVERCKVGIMYGLAVRPPLARLFSGCLLGRNPRLGADSFEDVALFPFLPLLDTMRRPPGPTAAFSTRSTSPLLFCPLCSSCDSLALANAAGAGGARKVPFFAAISIQRSVCKNALSHAGRSSEYLSSTSRGVEAVSRVRKSSVYRAVN